MRVFPDQTDHFVGRQLVGRFSLPDVAGLTAILTPIGQAEVQFQRSVWTCRCRSEECYPCVSRTTSLLDESPVESHFCQYFTMGLFEPLPMGEWVKHPGRTTDEDVPGRMMGCRTHYRQAGIR
jgi:hypothetical protein